MKLRFSKTPHEAADCYKRLVSSMQRQLTSLEVAEVVMTVVACKVFPKNHLMHIRRCIEVDNEMPSVDLEVDPLTFNPSTHVIVTCEESHVNHNLGFDGMLCGARVRGWVRGRCVVWW